jgi:hypothetical protein
MKKIPIEIHYTNKMGYMKCITFTTDRKDIVDIQGLRVNYKKVYDVSIRH